MGSFRNFTATRVTQSVSAAGLFRISGVSDLGFVTWVRFANFHLTADCSDIADAGTLNGAERWVRSVIFSCAFPVAAIYDRRPECHRSNLGS